MDGDRLAAEGEPLRLEGPDASLYLQAWAQNSLFLFKSAGRPVDVVTVSFAEFLLSMFLPPAKEVSFDHTEFPLRREAHGLSRWSSS